MHQGTTYRGKLTLCGTPPVDSMTFTGTFEDSVDFCWNPTDASKEFVVIGKNSTTTGDVEVAHGRLRLTDGATFSNLGTLTLSGGVESTFQMDDVPSAAFKAKRLVLATGNENLILAAGVTLTVGGGMVNGTRLSPGTYTSSNATWVKGAGSVVVEGRINCTLVWAKLATYKNLKWSNPENWINESTGMNDVPIDGDTIKLPGRGAYDAGGTAGRTDGTKNDLVNFRPRRIYVQGGYSSPGGNPVVFDGTDPSDGIYNDGFMYYLVPTIVNTDEITITAGNVGHRGDIYSTDGHRFTLRKKGNNIFGLQQGGGNTYTGLSRIELEQGKFSFSWQKFGVGTKFPVGLTVNYAGTKTYLQCSVNTTLRDFVITESDAVVGQEHYLGSQDNELVTLTVVGTPAVKSQVFTGVLQAPLSLTWAVDDPDCEFVFSGASSKNTTTNTLTITNGTVRLTGGATFTALGTLALTGGVGARFAVDTQPATAFHAKQLTLETATERVYVGGGVKIAVDAVTVNGVELSAGVYSAVGNIATEADWVEGGGFVCVGGADITLPTSTETTTANWTANGGSDAKLGTAANWGAADNTTLPDLATGSLVATFAAGAAAELDQRAAFRGLVLDAPGAFAFTKGTGTGAFLGSDGVQTAGSGKAYSLGWPLYLTSDQTWTVGAGDTLNLSSSFNGVSRLVFEGTGIVNMNATSTFGGEVVVSNGTMNVNADDAFGPSSQNPVSVDFKKTTFNLNGVTLKRPLKYLGGETFTLPANTTNVIEGDCDFIKNEQVTVKLGAGSTLRVKGEWKRGTGNWNYFRGTDAKNPGTLHLDGRLTHVTAGSANGFGENLNIYFNCAGNAAGMWLWMQGSNSRFYTTVPYAFTPYVNGMRSILLADGIGSNSFLDLCGNDQGVEAFGANANMVVTSAKPATLHIATDRNDWFERCATNKACWADAAGVSFEGTKFLCLDGTSTSTGTVQVTSGRLEFLSNGSWPNASMATVKGGSLVCTHKNVFGESTTLDLTTGGVMDLAYTGTMKVGALIIDGEEMPAGLYGGPDSPAAKKYACFSGTGVVNVGVIGTLLILR